MRETRPETTSAASEPRWHRRSVAGAVVLLVLLVLLLATWPLPRATVSAGAGVPAHPLVLDGATAEGHALTWGLWSAAGPDGPFLERRGGPEAGTFLGDGEHGALWRQAAAPLTDRIGASRAAALTTLALLLAAGILAYGCGRALGLGRWPSALATMFWLSSPALLERGLAAHAGLAPPTVPAAALLAAALVSLRHPLASSLGLGVVGALSYAVGPGTAGATALAAAIGAWCARRRTPRVAGGPTVIALGLSLAASTLCAGALWVENARTAALGLGAASVETPVGAPDRAAPEVPLRPGLTIAHPRPLAGPSPFNPLVRRVAGEESLVARRPAPALGMVALALGALVAVRVRSWRRSALAALAALAAAVSGLAVLAEPVLLPIGVLGLALVAARGAVAIHRRGVLIAVVLLAVVESVVVPWPLARWSPSPTLDRLASSPVTGSVLDLPIRAGAQASLSRQSIHGRVTLLPAFPDAAPAEIADLVRRAPSVGRLIVGQEPIDPEQLAAELEWVGVGHVLAEAGSIDEFVLTVLDNLSGWERAPDDGALHWWYRTRSLWTAESDLGR